VPRVVIAYSGGVDSALAIHWLRTERHFEVIAFLANVGQGLDLAPRGEIAIEMGAAAVHIDDLRDVLVNEFILPAFKANANYAGYLLSRALARPLIAREMVRIARDEGAEFVAHGATGRGNDQLRFEATFASLAPGLRLVAPLREWTLTSREDRQAYIKRHGLSLKLRPTTGVLSVDQNLWGTTLETAEVDDPWAAPPTHAWQMTVDQSKAPREPSEITIHFAEGVPVRCDLPEGVAEGARGVIEALNALAGRYGIGRLDVVEDRIVGIKTRQLYEAPAATVLIRAHEALEAITLSKRMLEVSSEITRRYSELVYGGWWHSGLREALDAFFAHTQRTVTGEVRMRLWPGSHEVLGRRSPHSLYDPELSAFGTPDRFHAQAAEGYGRLYTLEQRAEGAQRRKLEGR
jgi:argininosuccinate synthase